MNLRSLMILTMVCAMGLALRPARAADATKDPVSIPTSEKTYKTLEEQVGALEDALADALLSRDWKMVQLAAAGYKAAKLAPKDLEISILRAERGAAWKMAQQTKLEPWGIAVRALIGDASAKERLHAMGFNTVTPVTPPDYKSGGKDPVAFQKAQAEYQKYMQDCSERYEALLCLALMKEPGVAETVKTLIEARVMVDPATTGTYVFGGYGGDSSLVAALTADKDTAVQTVLSACENEKGSIGAQISLLSSLNSLTYQGKNGGEAFTVDQEAAASLPNDLGQKMGKTVSNLLVRYSKAGVKGYDNTFTFMINLAQMLPAKSMTKEGVEALASLRDKIDGQMAQWIKPQIDETLKKQGVDPNAAVKPPEAPKGDF